MVIPFGSGAEMGGEPIGAEAYMVVVRFPPEVYSDLINMVVYACKNGLDGLG